MRVNGVQKVKTCRRRVDAEAWEREILVRRNQGEFCGSAAGKITFKELAIYWMEHHCREKGVASYQAMCEGNLRKWILPEIGDKDFRRVTSPDIEAIGRKLAQSGKSPSTANRIFSLIRKIYNDAIKKKWFGHVQENPVRGIDFHSEVHQGFDSWSQEEATQFLTYAKERSPKAHPVYAVALLTGLRASEIFALSRDDVDLQHRCFTVSKMVEWRLGEIVERTKGKKTRYIGINDQLASILEDHFKKLERLKQYHQPHVYQLNNLLFPNERGNVFSFRNFCRDKWEKDRKRSGIRKIRFHDLRHTFASCFMMNGGSLYDLQQILGHSDTKTTQRYAHLSKGHLISKANIVSFPSIMSASAMGTS